MTWASRQRRINRAATMTGTHGTDLSGTMEGAGGIGGLLARSHGYSAGNWSTHNYYHADGNGNITHLVNSSQTLAASYRYDPYGNTISSSGTLASANLYRFSSKEFHANSGFYYYGYRWYAPNLQRWLNRDPIEEEGGLDLYAYCVNNPLGYVDPFGLDIVINKTGQPIIVSGNPGSGHGSGNQLFGVIPSDGKPHGGVNNPVDMYPSRDDAEKAAGVGGKKGPASCSPP